MFDWLKKLFGGKDETGVMMDENPETPVENTPEVEQKVEESAPEVPEEPIAQDSFSETPAEPTIEENPVSSQDSEMHS